MGVDRRTKKFVDQEIDARLGKTSGGVAATYSLALASSTRAGSAVYVNESDSLFVRLGSGLVPVLTGDAPDSSILSNYSYVPLGQPVYVLEFDSLYVQVSTGLVPVMTGASADSSILKNYTYTAIGQTVYVAELDAWCVKLQSGLTVILTSDAPTQANPVSLTAADVVALLRLFRRAWLLNGMSAGYLLQHNFGTLLGLDLNAFLLELRAYDPAGQLMGGVGFSVLNKDQATLTLDDAVNPFSGTLFLEVTPL